MPRDTSITDLIPRKPISYLLWFLGGVALIAGLEALYAWMPELSRQSSDGRVAAFDLDGEGSLAVWYSSAILALASLTALLVYSIRRHKPDDYHGRYRVWLWAAGCWLLMSIDECGSLHEGFKELMSHATGSRLFGDGSIWWAGAYLLLLSAIGIRLVLEMRACRAAIAGLASVAICYGVAVAAQLGWLLPASGAKGVMLEEGCEMLGNLCLLLTMAMHARYVILESKGLLPQKKAKPEPTADDAEARPRVKRGFWRRRAAVEPAHPTRPPHTRKSDLATDEPVVASAKRQRAEPHSEASSEASRAGRSSQPAQNTSEESDSDDGQRLTRSERKALRRAQRER